MNIQETSTSMQSYLRKLKRSSRFTDTNLRWFSLDLASGSFYYTKRQDSSEKYHRFNLGEVTECIASPDKVPRTEWKYAFQVVVAGLTYTLYAETISIYRNWCNIFKSLFKSGILTHRQIRRDYADHQEEDGFEDASLIRRTQSFQGLKAKKIVVCGYIKRRY